MSLGAGVQLAQHRETSRSCLKTRTDQNRTEKKTEQNRKKQNRTSESWDRLGSDGTGEKGTTGDFKEESSGFMMMWMQEEWGMVCMGQWAGTQHMPQILHCTTRIITTGK